MHRPPAVPRTRGRTSITARCLAPLAALAALVTLVSAGTSLAQARPTASEDRAAPGLAPSTLDRARVLSLARAAAPEVALARARATAARAAWAGTRAWARDNPTVSLAGGPRALSTGDVIADVVVGVSVPLELSGVSALRPRVADAAVRLAEAEADAVTAEAGFAALELWVRAAGAERALALATEQRAILSRAREIAATRVTLGASGGTDLALAALALAQGTAAEQSARAEVAAARAALYARLGIRPRGEPALVGALDPPPLATIDAMVSALSSHPRVAVALARGVVAEREWRALSATVWPAPRVSLGGGRENEWYARLGVDLSLPVFQRSEGALASARAQASLADAERRSVLLAAEMALREAYARALALEPVGGALEETVRAAAEVTRLATRSYELGERDVSVTLLAMRETNAARRALADWTVARALARIAVERATGDAR
jgi:cobalt-zinc-cadmium efflux system outer membrane protein